MHKSQYEKNNKSSTKLRYSFGHLERKLMHLKSNHQNVIYLIVKSIFYRWINPIDEDNLTSFLVKTIMLWTCEQYEPDSKFCDFYNNSSMIIITNLFKKLGKLFGKNTLNPPSKL